MRAPDSFESMLALVRTVEEFDRLTSRAHSDLLERAVSHTRRVLREVGRWTDDMSHEKLAIRLGYEFFQQFLIVGRKERPCRPLLLLESLIAQRFSQSAEFHQGEASLVGRFLEGLASRAVVSRDGLIALFYHLYGLSQGQVVRLLGIGPAESQRVYKNFERWRRTGWEGTLTEIGLGRGDLKKLEDNQRQDSQGFAEDATLLCERILNHYRKSEPKHFPCQSSEGWLDLFDRGYAYDYRAWHLALCPTCLRKVCRFRLRKTNLKINLHLQAPGKNKTGSFVLPRTSAMHKPSVRSTKDVKSWREKTALAATR